MLYCNTATVAATRRAGVGLGAGWAGVGRAARRAGRARRRGARGRQADAGRRRACRALGARDCWASGRRRDRRAGKRWTQAWARGTLGVSARGAWLGSAGRASWACLCAWWACWLGQLGQFGFW